MSKNRAGGSITGLSTALFVWLVPALSNAQQQRSPLDGPTPQLLAPGAPAGSYALSDFDHVNLFNGSLLVNLPLLRIGGRGGAQATIGLPLQRRWVLDFEVDQGTGNVTSWVERDNWDWNSPAFSQPYGVFGLGWLEARHVAEPNPDPCGNPNEQRVNTLTRLYFTSSDGTELELIDKSRNGEPATTCPQPPGSGPSASEWVTRDGSSSATFVSSQPVFYWQAPGTSRIKPGPAGVSGVLYLRNGTRFGIAGGVVTSLTDRNGNRLQLQETATGVTIQDSLGRDYQFVRRDPFPAAGNDPSAPCGTISFTGSGGAPRTILVSCSPLADALLAGQVETVGELFDPTIGGPPPLINPVYNPNVVSSVQLPDGRSYEFKYNPYGELERVTLPTGGAIRYIHQAGFRTGSASGLFYPGTFMGAAVYRRVVERQALDADGTVVSRTIYGRPEESLSTAGLLPYVQVDHQDPRDNDALLRRERHHLHSRASQSFYLSPLQRTRWKEGKETRTEILAASGTVLRTVENTWSQPDTNEQAPPNDPHIIETSTTFETGIQSRQTFGFDPKNNPIDTWEFGFDGQLLRHVHTEYSTQFEDLAAQPTVYILDLPTLQTVSGPGNISETSHAYDGQPVQDCPNVVGHDPAYGTSFARRGNLTAVTRRVDASNWISQTSRYDIAGNVIAARDANGNETAFDFTDRWGVVGDPAAPSGASTYAFPTRVTNPRAHVSYTRFDRYTGQAVQLQDPNGVSTELYYADSLDRPTLVIRAANQDDERTQTSHSYDDSARIITSTSDLGSFQDNVLRSQTRYDGLGRVVETSQRESASSSIVVQRDYDGLGRVSRVSNPSRGTPSAFTTTEYDALGRITRVSTPDGARTDTSYTGNETSVTDPAGKKRKSVTDPLGRVIQVVEDPGGSLQASTSYSYDALDNLTGVTQGAQTRSFSYDSLSRLESAQNPESGTVGYEYDANGNLRKRTDATGSVTEYSYDELNRIRSRQYSGPRSAQTEPVEYSYDTPGGFRTGRLSRVETPSSTTAFGAYDALGRVVAHQQRTNGRSYGTLYAYNRAGLLTSETYPTGRVVSTQYDGAGRVSGVTGQSGPANSGTTFLEPDSLGYAAHGALETAQFGSGRWEHTDFNLRLQPTRIGLGNSQTSSSLLKLDYDYGTGSNNGNVLSQTITLGSTSFVQGYGYDGLNRLMGASESKNGSVTWSQTYGMDRYGNRWVSSGYIPLPSLTPQSAGHFNASKNRLSMGASQYDGAGNLTTDPAEQAATYDAENRQVRFTAVGTNVEYVYDGDGRRVRKHEVAGHTWVYVYDALGRLITEHSSEDPARPAKDFIYAGSRMIAEVKGSIPGLKPPSPIGPVGTIDNCSPDATFSFSWEVVPGATEYILTIDGQLAGDYDADQICTTVCSVEPEASPTVQPFAPGPHTWSVQALDDAGNTVSSETQYYVIGPGPATPLSPSGAQSSAPTQFTWLHSPGTTQYNLKIDDQPFGSWSDEVCSGDTCTVEVPEAASLGRGEHVWRIHSVHPECELSSLPLHFTIGGGGGCGALSFTASNTSPWLDDPVTFTADMTQIAPETFPLWYVDGSSYVTGTSFTHVFLSVGLHTVTMSATPVDCPGPESVSMTINVLQYTCEALAVRNFGPGAEWACPAPTDGDFAMCPEGPYWTDLYQTPDCFSPNTCCGRPAQPGPPPTCQQRGGWCLGYSSDGLCPDKSAPLGPVSDPGCTYCCGGTPPPPAPSCSEQGGVCRSEDLCPTGTYPSGSSYGCTGGAFGDECCLPDTPPYAINDGICTPYYEGCANSPLDCPCWEPDKPYCDTARWPGECTVPPPPPPTCSEQGGVCSGGDPCPNNYRDGGSSADCSIGVCCLPDPPPSCTSNGCEGRFGWQLDNCEQRIYCGDPCDDPSGHNHTGSCGDIDECGHLFGASTDCGCPDAPTVWDTCESWVCEQGWYWQDEWCQGGNWVCDTCSSCWESCDEEGNCWWDCSDYACNCREETYSYVCGGHWEYYEYGCHYEPYPCNPRPCGY